MRRRGAIVRGGRIWNEIEIEEVDREKGVVERERWKGERKGYCKRTSKSFLALTAILAILDDSPPGISKPRRSMNETQ